MATLATVRTAIKEQGDFENDAHKSTSEINSMIVRAYREGWSLILNCSRDYFTKKTTFTLTGGIGSNTQAISSIATDFLESVKVERDCDGTGGYREDVLPYHIQGRNSVDGRMFTIYKDTLEVEPAVSAAGNYRLWYVYKPADPSADGDSLEDPTGLLEQFVIDTVVTRLMAKEETDASLILALRSNLRDQLMNMATKRRSPNVGVDVRGSAFSHRNRRRWYR